MSAAWATVIAATVTGSFGVIVALIHRFRKENRADHGQVMSVLGSILHSINRHDQRLEQVDSKLDRHIESHH